MKGGQIVYVALAVHPRAIVSSSPRTGSSASVRAGTTRLTELLRALTFIPHHTTAPGSSDRLKGGGAARAG